MKGANPFFVPEISDGTPEDGKMNSENGLPHFDDIPMFGGSISNFGKFIWWSQLILQQLTSPTSGPPSCWTNQDFASASCGNARAMAPIPRNHDLMPKQTCIPYKCVSNICASPKNAYIHKKHYTSSTAQGGGGSFKNRKPIGELGCCESGMAERIHWWTERCLRSPLFLSLSLTTDLTTYLSIYLSICLSTCLSVVQCHSE